MMNRNIARVAATAVAITFATVVSAQDAVAPAAAQSQLAIAGQWTPLVVFVGLLIVVGILLLVTRQGFRPSPWELEEAEAAVARGWEPLRRRTETPKRADGARRSVVVKDRFPTRPR
jgi:hypothetical protein